jgi:Lipase (class 3)
MRPFSAALVSNHERSCRARRCELRPDQVSVYTFGCPRIGNCALAREYEATVPDTWHVINDRDVVTQALKVLGWYKRAGQRVLVYARGDMIVRPTLVEASLLQVCAPRACLLRVCLFLDIVWHAIRFSCDAVVQLLCNYLVQTQACCRRSAFTPCLPTLHAVHPTRARCTQSPFGGQLKDHHTVAYHRALAAVVSAQLEGARRGRAEGLQGLLALLQDAPIVRLTLQAHAHEARIPLDETLDALAGVAPPQRCAEALASLPRGAALYDSAEAAADLVANVDEAQVVDVATGADADGVVAEQVTLQLLPADPSP